MASVGVHLCGWSGIRLVERWKEEAGQKSEWSRAFEGESLMAELPKNVFKCGGVEKGRGELGVCLNLGCGRKYGEWDERLPLYLVVMMCC